VRVRTHPTAALHDTMCTQYHMSSTLQHILHPSPRRTDCHIVSHTHTVHSNTEGRLLELEFELEYRLGFRLGLDTHSVFSYASIMFHPHCPMDILQRTNRTNAVEASSLSDACVNPCLQGVSDVSPRAVSSANPFDDLPSTTHRGQHEVSCACASEVTLATNFCKMRCRL